MALEPPCTGLKMLQHVSIWRGFGGLHNLPKSTLVPNLPAKTPHSPTKMSPRAICCRCWVDVREIFGSFLVKILIYLLVLRSMVP